MNAGTILHRREFLKFAGVSVAAMASPLESIGKLFSKKPNIVVILADDMGFSDIGCFGGEIDTPNIDSLADHGLKFTQFYNAARCCPTRASLLTGLYPHQAGIGHMHNDRGIPSYQGYLNNHCLTIAEALKPANYSAYIAGKWHVCHFDMKTDTSTQTSGWPLQRGFDKFYGSLAGAGSYYDPLGLMRNNERIKPDKPEYYFTNAISDNAVTFVGDHAKEKPDKPFFMYVAYTAPHWPLQAPEKQIAKYKGRYDKGWDVLRTERHKKMLDMGIVDETWPLAPRDSEVPAWEKTENKAWWSRCMEVYAAQVDIMDKGIGRIIAKLKKTGQFDNTLIMFLSDNGGCHETIRTKGWYQTSGISKHFTRDGRAIKIGNYTDTMPGPATTYASYSRPWAQASNTPFRKYKSWSHEGGISTPLIVHWPEKIKAKGKLRRQPGHVIDIMATCLDVSGAKFPKTYNDIPLTKLPGKSLTPAFDADKPITRDALYFEHMGGCAIIKDNLKLVSDKNNGPWELYDLKKDRTELNNIIEKYPEKAKELENLYQKWADNAGVKPWAEIKPPWA